MTIIHPCFLTLEALYRDIKIKKQQLHNIYDVWIILAGNPYSDSYTVKFIGKETNPESDALFTYKDVICPVHNDSSDLDEHICFIG